MNQGMSKAELIEILQSKRAEWDAILAKVPSQAMLEPGVADEWSVKDIIAHLNYYERWMADRLHEQLRGENYVPTELDFMDSDQRNAIIFRRYQNHALEDILAESQQAFQQLLQGVQAHSETFLIEPQQFEGAPGPIVICQMIRGEVYDHYGLHIPSIESWLVSHP